MPADGRWDLNHSFLIAMYVTHQHWLLGLVVYAARYLEKCYQEFCDIKRAWIGFTEKKIRG